MVMPKVSIIMPLFNDEEYVSAAIESCLAQTQREIEIVCVDDDSTDGTARIVAEYAAKDPRVRLIRQPKNGSAFQARRVGIAAASAPYVLFLDGDDALAPETARLALDKAVETGADVVGFGVELIVPDGGTPRKLEAALQPVHDELVAPEIIPALFPVGGPTNGHLWRYLFATSLLRSAYAGFAEDTAFYRANDLPISFLALSAASKYVSVRARLYRYHFRRGTSGHAIEGIEHFRFLLSGVGAVTSIEPMIQKIAALDSAENASRLLASYESARLHVIGNVLRNCIQAATADLRSEGISLLQQQVGELDVVRAASGYCREALKELTSSARPPKLGATVARRVLLTTSQLDLGGLQNVLREQATQLVSAGYEVTVAVMNDVQQEIDLPEQVTIEVLDGGLRERVDRWIQICQDHEIDVIIDHHILYNERWPWLVLAALACGVPTIGWVHTFSLRPVFDSSQRASFVAAHGRALSAVVTLSPTDVAFWKFHGLDHVYFLPNPPSALAQAALEVGNDRELGDRPIELAWWGRLDRPTKQVDHLIKVAAELRKREIDFHLTIIGPSSRNLTAKQLRTQAISAGVDDAVEFVHGLQPQELLDYLQHVDVLVSTSAIEGYQLTIVEAQALGIPVVMYELPWLQTVKGNPGLVLTAPNAPLEIADALAGVATDAELYAALSRDSRTHARRLVEVDTSPLLFQLLAGTLPATYSPEPTLDDARVLTEWLVLYAERNIRVTARKTRSNEDELTRTRRQLQKTKQELDHIMAGPSFKVGRVITLLPRKLRDALRPSQKKTASQPIAAPKPSPNKVAATTDEVVPPLSTDAPAPAHRAENPDVTFVIPVYNSERWLRDCLSSVLAQSGVELEVICVNDGSSDGSRDILQSFANVDPRVSIIDQENSGQSVARNQGIDAARGRYMIYLDSDDYWTQDALSSLVARADADALDLLLFDCFSFRDGDVDPQTWRRYANYYQRTYSYRQVRTGANLMAAMRRTREYRPHVGLYIARTEFVRASGVRFIPGIVHQDNPYTFRLLMNAARAAHIRLDAYARRLRPGSTITTLNAERSARGYYLSYLEMTRELAAQTLTQETAAGAEDILNAVQTAATTQFAALSKASAAEIRALAGSAESEHIFDTLWADAHDGAEAMSLR